MRKRAKKLGYRLSEYDLVDSNGIAVKINSEKDVFDVLDMKYIDPQLR